MYEHTDYNVIWTYYRIYQGIFHQVAKHNPVFKQQLERIADGLPIAMKCELRDALADAKAKDILEDFSSPENCEMPTYDFHCRVISYEEALKPLPPIEWIIEPLFSAGSLSILVGCPGSLKSYVLLDAALHVSAGQNWLDYPTKQSPVLYIDEEAGERRLFYRTQEIRNGRNFPDKLPLHMTTMEGFNFTDPEWFTELRKIITNKGIRFVVVDSLIDVIAGVDENSAKETSIVIRELGRLAKEMDCAIVAIHHKGKSGDYRGSTAIEGGVDLMLEVKKNKKDVKLEFSVIKSRDIDDNFTLTALPTFGEGKFSMKNTGPIQRTSQIHEDVFNFIKANSNSSVNSIMADLISNPTYAFGKPKTADDGKKQTSRLRERIRSVVNDLVEREKIYRTNKGGNGIEALYSVVEIQ